MRTLTALLFATLLALSTPAAHAALPPGISGAWYNPAQSGHGLTVEMLAGDRALVFWHVFDPQGEPVHLYIEGNVVGHGIEGQAYLGRGMRFGSFDRADHTLEHWGSVRLAFSGCNAASLDWQADGPAGLGYADGSMPLRRLTGLAGLECARFPADPLPAGRYTVDYVGSSLFAAVDSQQRLWATGPVTPQNWAPPSSIHLVLGAPVTGSWPAPALELELVRNVAFSSNLSPGSSRIGPLRLVDTGTALAGSVDVPGVTGMGLSVSREFDVADPLHYPLQAQDLVGLSFGFELRDQFSMPRGTIHFSVLNNICIDTPDMRCRFRGTMGSNDPGLGMLDFTLEDHAFSTRISYSGKLWILRDPNGSPAQVVLVARGNGAFTDMGMGLVGHLQPPGS